MIFASAYSLWHKEQWAKGIQQDIAPRYARLLGVKQAKNDIDAQLERVQRDLTRFAFPDNTPADHVSTEIQQRVRRFADAGGLTVTSSQMLPVKTNAGFEETALTVTLDGSLEGLQRFLLKVQSDTPRMQVSDLDIRPKPVARGKDAPATRDINVRLTVSDFRLLP